MTAADPSPRISSVVSVLTMVLLTLGGLSPRASAQQVRLAWVWRDGDERRYIVQSHFNQVITYDRSDAASPGQNRPPPRPSDPRPEPAEQRTIKCEQTFHVVERVESTDDAGVATVTWTYERVQVTGTDAGPDGTESFSYDSAHRSGSPATSPGSSPPPNRSPRQRLQSPGTNPGSPASPAAPVPPRDNPDHPLIAPFAALAGRTITFRIDPEGRVLSCEGGDEAMEAAFSPMEGGGDSPFNPLALLFKAAVTNESLAQQFQQGLSLIPNRIVRRGESWPLSLRQTLPLVGALRSEIECRLTGLRGRPGAQTATITNKGEMILEGGDAGARALGGLFQIHLGMSEQSGTTEFDVEGGFVRSQQQRMVSEWELYAPDWDDLDRLGEPMRVQQRLEQDMSMRLEP